MFTSAYILFLIIVAVFGGDENQAKLRFYNGAFENYTELPFDEAHNIFSYSWFNPNGSTTIFCHGFTGYPEGPAVTAIIKAYLEQGLSNVVLLNWDKLAAPIYGQLPPSYLYWAIPNAIKLGADFADLLVTLSEHGLDLNKTHLVGHSLGAHVIGITGIKMTKMGIQLPWITGLDPAGIIFDGRPPSEKLNPNSAGFVDVIHSDPSRYGSRKSLGRVDFWPNFRNGAVVQPGCGNGPHPRFSPEDLCNHNRSWQYLIDSMKYPGSMLGSYAKNFRTWKNYSKSQRNQTVLELGKYNENAVPGDYYFLTSASSPYGLGENGL